MSLNIKSAEADRLVTVTGESKTQAFVEALRERLERTKRDRDQRKLAADPQSGGHGHRHPGYRGHQ